MLQKLLKHINVQARLAMSHCPEWATANCIHRGAEYIAMHERDIQHS